MQLELGELSVREVVASGGLPTTAADTLAGGVARESNRRVRRIRGSTVPPRGSGGSRTPATSRSLVRVARGPLQPRIDPQSGDHIRVRRRLEPAGGLGRRKSTVVTWACRHKSQLRSCQDTW